MTPWAPAATVRPVDWTPALVERPPYFCERCWADFAHDVIGADELLRTIEHPVRVWTSWGCPRCDTWEADETLPTREECEMALLDIRAHIAQWAVGRWLDEPF